MKIAAVLAVLFTSVFAQADIIKCNFTEPFFSATYSMTQSKLTISSPEAKDVVTKNVSFQIKAAGEFVLLDKNNQLIMTLTVDKDGSDGMSNIIYPMTGKFDKGSKWANGGFGGCSSNYLKTTQGED